MRIGKLIDLPGGRGLYATVRDEYGNAFSVPADQVPKDVEEQDEVSFAYAFEVNLSQNAGIAANLKKR